MKKTVVIAGASGFIGRWFIQRFHDKYNIIAISRSEVLDQENKQVIWRQADLYSLSSTESALQGADYALYLVHSMEPSTRLNQSSFEDTDLLLADNFARAAKKCGLEQIIFMGGILPKESRDFSRHLRSRYETELTLQSKSVPVTVLRAGIIIGPGGSSFKIMENLVRNLPIMACPKWCSSPSQPIDIEDVLNIIDQSLGNEATFHKQIEIGGEKQVTYIELLRFTAKAMGKKRLITTIPFFTLGFSKLWVGLFSNSSITFVSPLIESLRHDMTVKPDQPYEYDVNYMDIEESVRRAIHEKAPSLNRKTAKQKERNTVRSVQRLPNQAKKTVEWVANEYPRWLASTLRYFFTANVDESHVRFCLFRVELLKLQFIGARSDKDRQLFYIVGGKLVKRTDHGWLEFRSVLNNEYVIAAIHEFVPKLPWGIYKYTQAVVHLMVMNGFGRYLNRQR